MNCKEKKSELHHSYQPVGQCAIAYGEHTGGKDQYINQSLRKHWHLQSYREEYDGDDESKTFKVDKRKRLLFPVDIQQEERNNSCCQRGIEGGRILPQA